MWCDADTCFFSTSVRLSSDVSSSSLNSCSSSTPSWLKSACHRKCTAFQAASAVLTPELHLPFTLSDLCEDVDEELFEVRCCLLVI